MSGGLIVCLMLLLFVLLAVLGVPVAFALLAAALVGGVLSGVGLESIVGQLFVGVNSVPLLAVPFFILVGELMASSNVTERLVQLAQALVGHLRSGLAQVVTVFSMFFAGVSGSSMADVGAVGRVMLPPMKREGYNPGNSAALVAAAGTIAHLIPPSIMAVVYGAISGVSVAALFVGGAVPGVMIGAGLMVYSYLFGSPGTLKTRASVGQVARAAGASVLPLMVPVIIVGGILAGYFTPTEAGMVAVVYTLLVIIPLIVRSHFRALPRDFANAAALYALPMTAVAAASAFGWLIAYHQTPQALTSMIGGFGGTSRVLVMTGIVVALIVAGQFLDAIPAIVIFSPVIGPLTEMAGIDPVHMGIVAITALAFGLITPPYGLALLLSTSLADIPFSKGLVRALPLYLVFLAALSVMIIFPSLVLWLPSVLGIY